MGQRPWELAEGGGVGKLGICPHLDFWKISTFKIRMKYIPNINNKI
jgi:hypothetical protein